jgi:hypothetical protein
MQMYLYISGALCGIYGERLQIERLKRKGIRGEGEADQNLLCLYIYILSSMRATCPASIVLLDETTIIIYNPGCLHPVACVRSGDGDFYPSAQRHYRMLILLYYYTATCFGRTTIFRWKIYNSLRIT